ncbi:hypothetical protein [Candidatus Pyrohabitans sp.]
MVATTEESGISALISVSELIEQRRKLKNILEKYGVSRAEEIEEKIIKGEIPEHPAYEDYLSALAYEKNISDLKAHTRKVIEEI